MAILIDSNIIIGFLRGESSIVKFMEQIVKENNPIFISSISVYEVYLGIIANLYLKKGRPHLVDQFLADYNQLLQACTVLEFSKEAAEKSAIIYAQAQGKGIIIKQNDCLIAGSALSVGISRIITRDKQDFEKIKKIAGIEFSSF
ncbi:MAG: PIN domain-containing protein [Candidatus Lokiarchaeota archaeon]|nr:PIN domain-containing protein [Candidatus Harpocratesius repetitus]